MAKHSKTSPRNPGHGNPTFARIVDQLSDFGVTQQEVARQLGISAGQLSRVKKGERPATERNKAALRKFLAELRRARKDRDMLLARQAPAHSIFFIDHGVLNRLSPCAAIEAFRDLLFARAAALGIATTSVNISSNVCVPDGGVDASVSEVSVLRSASDELLDAGTRFQIKTGDFKPWQRTKVKAELFGTKAIRFENLGSGIQAALTTNKRFVLVCFGVDPTDRELREARRHFADLFAECGYTGAKVEVWCRSHLIGLYHEYPSLCLRLRGFDHDTFRSHDSWSRDDDMRSAFHSAERSQLVHELRQKLLSNEVGHLRLLGEPGIGKTRLALEITKDAQLSPLTLYVREGRALLQSTFINELVQSDDHRFVVLVVDECSTKDRAELWNRLKAKSNRVRIISIDHGPDDSVDDRMRTVQVVGIGVDDIVAILMERGLDKNEARRWSDFCQGCPRVAHVLGDNLRMDRVDLLQSPATVDVWNRFVVGNDPEDSEEVQLRKVVLRHVALFDRFGFTSPVADEAQFISRLAAQCDPRLTWGRFQSIVRSLQRRRILQGTTTLYLMPRLLHVHLFRDFWQNYGSTLDIATALSEMPPTLWVWFVGMMRYAHDIPAAERAIDKALQSPEMFPRGEFSDHGEHGRIIEVLAETCPKAVVRCLQRTIGEMDIDALMKLNHSRQLLVWALEKIAVWREHFVDAASLLLKLAQAENSNHGNNATGTFVQLFSLNPGFAPTQAEPALRLTLLREALDSQIADVRNLGLKACAKSLNTATDHRIVGPEYQGLRKRVEFWMPTTYGELWNSHRDIWELLVSKCARWTGEDKKRLFSTVVSAAWHALHVPGLNAVVVQTLRMIAGDADANVSDIAELIKRQLRHSEGLNEDVRAELEAIYKSLDGDDFSSQLRRFVRFVTWEDLHNDNGDNDPRVNSILCNLADQAIADLNLLQCELPWLVQEGSGTAYSFATRLSQRDPQCTLFNIILAHYGSGGEYEPTFIAGYLAGVFDRDITQWEALIAQVASNTALEARFSDIVVASGMSNSAAEQVVTQCKSGKQSRERLERWWFAPQLKALSPNTIEGLVALQLDSATGRSWSNAVHMWHTYFMDGDETRRLPEELTFALLLHVAIAEHAAAHDAGYYWSRLASAFLRQYSDRKWEFFRTLLRVCVDGWSILSDLNTQGEMLITELLREEPEKAFSCIAEVLGEGQDLRGHALTNWLSEGGHRIIGDDSPGPIQYIPSRVLFSWAVQDVDNRGVWLAHILPKTLDESVAGRMTRDFIARFGADRELSSSLYARFYSRGWCGRASDHYRRLRDQARGWLVDEKDATVLRWLGEYIDGLNDSITRAEIEEERRA
jgi:transposase-like protein